MKQVFIDDKDSNSYTTDTSWKQNIAKEERIFSMIATDASDSNTSVDSLTAKKLLKNFQK